MAKTEAAPPSAIRAKRQAFGLTQVQAAALVHTVRRTWQDWESGRHPMPPAVWELFQLKLKALP